MDFVKPYSIEDLKQMDIVYFVKDAVYNEELRYSLRSLKNFPHNRVWFIGGKPLGLHPDKQIVVQQKGATKWDRVRNMMKMVAENEEITKDFVLFNDDFFIMSPVIEFANGIYGTLSDLIVDIEIKHGYRATPYTLSLKHTVAALREIGQSNFELHRPMVVNRAGLLCTIRDYPDVKGTRSLYGNTHDISPLEETVDHKIVSFDEVPDKLPQFLSTDDFAFEKEKIGKLIRDSFPDKSLYER